MFPYTKKVNLDSTSESNYFNCYGVKLKSNDSTKNSYLNTVIHLLININREFAYGLFEQICGYEGKDPILSELKSMLKEIANIFEENKAKMEALLDSEVSNGKPKNKFESGLDIKEDPAMKEIDTSGLVDAIENSEYKDCLDPSSQKDNGVLDLILLKYHQLFKDEFDCSIFQPSNDNEEFNSY